MTPISVGILLAVLLLAVGLFLWLRRQGRPLPAVLVPVVLLAAFLGALRHELGQVYSLEHRDGTLLMQTPLGVQTTACQGIEFLVRTYRSTCVVHGYRDDDEIFYSAGVPLPRCTGLEQQLRQLPCKPSDGAGDGGVRDQR